MFADKRVHLFFEFSLYEAVRQRLLERSDAELDRPLANWVMAGDRALPLALMRYSLRDVLQTPFDELCARPGIGRKKIHSLVSLLHRAADEDGPGVAAAAPDVTAVATEEQSHGHDDLSTAAEVVSERMWQDWQATVRRHALERQTLGEIVSSLRHLPRSLWTTPLATYLELSLAEVQRLPRHGDARVSVIQQVFGRLHAALTPLDDCLTASIRPQNVSRVHGWLAEKFSLPSADELGQHFILPIIDQVRVDDGDMLADAVGGSLFGDRQSAADQSVDPAYAGTRHGQPVSAFYRRKVAAIISARWPRGEQLFMARRARWSGARGDGPAVSLLNAAQDWFFGIRHGKYREPVRDNRDGGQGRGIAYQGRMRSDATSAAGQRLSLFR